MKTLLYFTFFLLTAMAQECKIHQGLSIEDTRTYRIGVLANRGVEASLKEQNETFTVYLTATAGRSFDPPISFEMIPIPFGNPDPVDVFQNGDFDFVFANPSIISCISSEMGATPIANTIARRNIGGKTYNLTEFGGVIFTLADRNDINDISDMKDKRIGTVAFSGLGSGQMQFREMINNGVHHLQDPKQVIFMETQGRIVNGVLNKEIDVGFVRTDQLERSVDSRTNELLDLSLIKIIGAKKNLNNEGMPFPFDSSTRLYPDWIFANLPHVPDVVIKAVSTSLMNMAHYAAISPSLLACYEKEGCGTNIFCQAACFSSLDDGVFETCDTTIEIAHLAHAAMLSGKHSGFRTALPSMQLRNMQQEIGYIKIQPEARCLRTIDITDGIVCPEGYVKRSDDQILRSCHDEGLDCYGFECICNPCIMTCDSKSIELGNKCIPIAAFLPLILVPAAILLFLLAYTYVEIKKRQNDIMWKVKPEQLSLDETPKVLGRGTFGLVLLAEYRGTNVAVKRILPPKADYSSGIVSGSGIGQIKMIQDKKKSQFDFGDNEAAGSQTPEAVKGWRIIHKNLKWNNGKASYSYSTLQSISRARNYAKLKKNLINEMRLVSNLRHPCITTVMGAVISPNSEPMLVMEHMEFGSLYDLLHNESMILDGEAMQNILYDIARGVRFLHAAEPPVIHCDLKSMNVLVDNKMHAKVTDFGLSAKQGFLSRPISGTPYWMAPELLRGESKNTIESDIYAFGILLYEVFSRKEPYQGEDVAEVLQNVADDKISKRPPVPVSCPKDVASLMKACLLANPSERPAAKDIDLRLRMADMQELGSSTFVQSKQSIKKNIDDRTEALLWQLFPKHIAAALREGRKVEPETHADVTVFFSEIVGYADISASLSPTKLSKLLDRLYTKLDDLTRVHKVFKVETIGDSYMAVTNLAIPQEDHIRTMAYFAFDVLDAAEQILIDEDDPSSGFLQLQAGFHTGPVVAHVVGATTPRYSLIGDTVNIAAGIEQHTKAGTVNCSEKCAILLEDDCLDIAISRRGKVQIKGKGDMVSYVVRPVNRVSQALLGHKNSSATEDSTGSDDADARELQASLITWHVEILEGLLRKIATLRMAQEQLGCTASPAPPTLPLTDPGKSVFEEVKEFISFPNFDPDVAATKDSLVCAELCDEVKFQLRDFVSTICMMYRDNAFHNFEHASHITMSVLKLLSKLVPAETDVPLGVEAQEAMHKSSFGISSDPISQFGIVMSALIHDTDHPGIPNARLIQEESRIAKIYKDKSVAEQNSVDLAWGLLMDPKFQTLRYAICRTEEEMQRFRSVVINCVLATDIIDKELVGLRRERWNVAFSIAPAEQRPEEVMNRKATILLEYMIQASDVAHMMQQWPVYRKWNERFFKECNAAYEAGRADAKPADGWYKGEIGFFEFYVIPLAKKLRDSEVFGDLGEDYLNHAMENKQLWEKDGVEAVDEMVQRL